MTPAPPAKQHLVGAGLVAATYAYFLLFAQFAFLELANGVFVRSRVTPGHGFYAVLGLQGLGGLLGSLLAAWVHQPARARWLAAAALLVAGAAAGCAPGADSVATLGVIAGATGLALGIATVVIAASLRSWTGARLGSVVGLGTGVAYAFCSAPPLFAASPGLQAAVSLVVALAGAGLALLAGPVADAPAPSRPALGQALPWFAIFAALVALDSAAFYLLQHRPSLKAAVWSGEIRQWGVACSHLLAGVAAGRLLDAGRIRLGPSLAVAAIVLACLALVRPAGWISLLYAAGVSLYSAAFVHHAAQSARAGYAAAFYLLCGWLASGVGLGLAQGRHEITPALVAPLALLAAAGLVLARPSSRNT